MLSPEANKIPFTFAFFSFVTSHNIWERNEKKATITVRKGVSPAMVNQLRSELDRMDFWLHDLSMNQTNTWIKINYKFQTVDFSAHVQNMNLVGKIISQMSNQR